MHILRKMPITYQELMKLWIGSMALKSLPASILKVGIGRLNWMKKANP